MHLNFKNSSSSRRLYSVLHNGSNDYIGNLINATLISSDAILNISYVFNITDEAIVCSMDDEYSCDIDFIDNAIQTTNNKGNLSVKGIHYILHLYLHLSKHADTPIRRKSLSNHSSNLHLYLFEMSISIF